MTNPLVISYSVTWRKKYAIELGNFRRESRWEIPDGQYFSACGYNLLTTIISTYARVLTNSFTPSLYYCEFKYIEWKFKSRSLKIDQLFIQLNHLSVTFQSIDSNIFLNLTWIQIDNWLENVCEKSGNLKSEFKNIHIEKKLHIF